MNRTWSLFAVVCTGLAAPTAWGGDTGSNGHGNRTTIYLTRHPDDQIQLVSTGPGTFRQDCNTTGCCVERATDLGLERAKALADWFDERGITDDLDEVIATHKPRTAQMVWQIAVNAGLDLTDAVVDQVPGDGVHNVPSTPPECGDPAFEGSSSTLAPTSAYLHALPLGSTVLVAAHSTTIYPILNAFGIATTDPTLFPGTSTRVSGFNNLWEISVDSSGHATLEDHWILDVELDESVHQHFGHGSGCSEEPSDHDDD